MKNRKHICYICEKDISKEIHYEQEWKCFCTGCLKNEKE